MDRKVAPTVIIILIICLVLLQAGILVFVLSKEGLGVFWNLIISLVPLAFIGALITVYIERMKEIDEEDKDDLSKY